MPEPSVTKDITRRERTFFTQMSEEDRRQWIKGIVDRMMQAWGIKNKKQLADILSLNAKAPSNWIQKGSVPWRAIFVCSCQTGRTLDWLYYGQEPALLLGDNAVKLLKQRIEAFLEISRKAKQISEANDNGLASLADALSDDIKAFLQDNGEIAHDMQPLWWLR